MDADRWKRRRPRADRVGSVRGWTGAGGLRAVGRAGRSGVVCRVDAASLVVGASPVPSHGVLAFERRVVAALTESTEPDRRAAVAAWVDGCLREMPEHLRAGVAAESLALGGWAALRSGFGHHDDVMEGLARSRLTPVRQYVRLFRSLVLFADLELSRPADR
jgi:hypothetical protein